MTSLPVPPQKVSLSLPPYIRSTPADPWYTDCPLMPDGSTLLTWRYWIVPSGLRSSSLLSSQSVVDRSSATVEPNAVNPAAVPARLASWNLQSAVANASAFSVFVLSVLRWMISANEFPSSCVRRFRPGVRAR